MEGEGERGDSGVKRDGRGGRKSERQNLSWSLCSRGLFGKAAFRVTGLAPSASAVTGNYKQAKCVTCPNAVAESLRGHRAHAGWLAGRPAGRLQDQESSACSPLSTVPLGGTANTD